MYCSGENITSLLPTNMSDDGGGGRRGVWRACFNQQSNDIINQ